ncbi:MAG TPA: tetratricopeptide repeat protein [Gemmatimonadaceae bacterium]|nr:tetratricopeptide repeat protein [Gemmatimonadaceae bacterium]
MAHSALIEDLERQFLENPRRVFARLANEYRKSGDYERAIEVCSVHVPQQPSYISGHIVLGQALFETGRYDEAQRSFETAISLDPENLIALRQLGDIARERGDAGTAREWYQRLLEVDPQNEEVALQVAALDQAGAEGGTEGASAESDGPPSWSDIHPEDAASGATSPAPEQDIGAPAGLEHGAQFGEPASYEAPPPDAEGDTASGEPAAQTGADDGLAPWERAAAQAGGLERANEWAEEHDDAGGEPALLDLPADAFSAETPGEASGNDDAGTIEAPAGFEPSTLASEDDTAVRARSGVEGIIRETGPFDSDDFEELELTSPITAHEDRVVHVEDGVSASAGLTIDTGSLNPDREVLLPQFAADETLDVDVIEVGAPARSDAPHTAPDHGSPTADAPPVAPAAEATAHTQASSVDSPDIALPAEEAPVPAAAAPGQGAAAEGGEFVTETMAELYVKQGFTAEALGIYRQLSRRDPANAAWRDRVAALEAEMRAGVTAPRVGVAEHVAPEATVGALLSRIAARLAPAGWEPGGAAQREAAPEMPREASPLDAPEPVAPRDETAAATLAGAFAPQYHPSASPPAVPRATREAPSELSLDDVFRERGESGGAPAPAGSGGAGGAGLSFDEFFSPRKRSDDAASEGTPPSTGPGDADGSTPPEASDLELFHAWLEGLKK